LENRTPPGILFFFYFSVSFAFKESAESRIEISWLIVLLKLHSKVLGDLAELPVAFPKTSADYIFNAGDIIILLFPFTVCKLERLMFGRPHNCSNASDLAYMVIIEWWVDSRKIKVSEFFFGGRSTYRIWV